MRAFLREPSTPWIVFDREGRPPSQLAVGEMLSVPRRTVLSLSDANFFPATAIIDSMAANSRAEPSSLAVASDLEAEDARSAERAAEPDASAPLPMFKLSRRVLAASGAALAVVSLLAIGAVALRGSSASGGSRNVASTQLVSRSFGAPIPADIPPPDLDVPPTSAAAPAAESTPAPAAAASEAANAGASAAAPAETPVKAVPRKFARLSITGEARSRDVYLDRKRLLGHGTRSFTILCGPHIIGIGARSDTREVDIACTGSAELVISK